VRAFDVANWRKHFRLTQADLAALIGTSRVTIGNWESGSSRPSAADILALHHLGHDLMMRPGYGPVTLSYYLDRRAFGTNALAPSREIKDFETNEAALTWLTEHWANLPDPAGSWIEENGHQIWSGPALQKEITRRLEATQSESQRSPEEIERRMRAIREIVEHASKLPLHNPNFGDDDLYDERGLFK
jgi:transcriptional regulator with XRE-family HTH domain